MANSDPLKPQVIRQSLGRLTNEPKRMSRGLQAAKPTMTTSRTDVISQPASAGGWRRRAVDWRWLLGAQVEVAGGQLQPLLVLAARSHV
jgi:hypothetical protein